MKKLQRKSSVVEAMIEVHIGCWEIREQGSINPDWEGREERRFPDGAVPEI